MNDNPTIFGVQAHDGGRLYRYIALNKQKKWEAFVCFKTDFGQKRKHKNGFFHTHTF